jgi:uncharacterized protein (TIGR03089 family)
VTPEQLFDAVLTAGPSRPFVTFYDEASGERSELSARSLGNWVAKTHFLLMDELGLGVGDAAFVALPAHWISVPALLGCCTAGLTLTDSPDEAAVAFVAPETAAAATAVPDVFAVAPQSAAVGFGDAVPTGTADYVAAVRPQPDRWPTVQFPAGDADPGWGELSRGEIVARARQRAQELGVGAGARVLTARDWSTRDDWLDTVFVPLAVGGSVVFVRNAAGEDVLERRAAQERATIRI